MTDPQPDTAPEGPDPAPDGLPPLREVIARHGLGARKELGQNFLLDLNLTGRIARVASGLEDGTVIEVGPGPGGLTRALLMAGATNLVSLEKDPRCLPVLEEIAAAYPGCFRFEQTDALTADVTALGPAPRRIVANLPYNIATALLLRWLARAEDITEMVLMFQKEVVDRLTAQPGTKAYGRLSVITQWRCTVRAAFDVNPRAFAPPPKVVSTVAHIVPRAKPLYPVPMADLEAVTAAAFGQRRKMLRAALKSLAGDQTPALCAAADIDPTRRAETLSVTEFSMLAETWRQMRG